MAVADLPLCDLRLQNDARWPWLVLIPRRDGLTELTQLDTHEWASLRLEIAAAERGVRALGDARGQAVEKINVGALGNVVPQLHLHVLGRHAGDPAWPGPVWGFGAPEPLEAHALKRALSAVREALPA